MQGLFLSNAEFLGYGVHVPAQKRRNLGVNLEKTLHPNSNPNPNPNPKVGRMRDLFLSYTKIIYTTSNMPIITRTVSGLNGVHIPA